jgi:peptide/nickel transport system substrate-binding protein
MMRRARLRSTPRGARGAWALLLGALLALAAACGGAARDPDVFVLASGSDLESANPVVTVHTMSRQMQRHMLFMPLVRLDSALQPEPWLAERWRWNADRTEVVFILRRDLPWHDGVPTTAHDVVVTFEAVQDPDTGSPRAGDFAAVTVIEAIGDSAVRIAFDASQPAMPLVFAELPPVPAHLLEHVPHADWRRNAFSTAPVGNGPFRFVSRDPGQRWRFARNEQFPLALGGPPPAREIVIAVVDEPATKFAGLVSGELDLAGVSPAMATLVSRDPLLVLESPPVLFSTMLAFNTTVSPFDDARVRRAVSLAIDRQRIVDAAVAGFGVPSTDAVPPGVLGAVAPAPAPDSAAAAALLEASGWAVSASGVRERNGVRLEITLITVGSGDLAVEQLLQSDLQRVGIALTIRSVELATFLTELRAPEKRFALAYTGVPGELGLGHLRALLHGDQAGGALDYTGYHTATLDGLLDAARLAEGPDARRVAWQQVSAHLDSVVPVAFVYHARGVQGRARSVDGVRMDLRGELASIAAWRRAR